MSRLTHPWSMYRCSLDATNSSTHPPRGPRTWAFRCPRGSFRRIAHVQLALPGSRDNGRHSVGGELQRRWGGSANGGRQQNRNLQQTWRRICGLPLGHLARWPCGRPSLHVASSRRAPLRARELSKCASFLGRDLTASRSIITRSQAATVPFLTAAMS